MKVIIEPKTEEEVCKATTPEADPDEVQEQVRTRYEGCVVHLCGCNCKC